MDCGNIQVYDFWYGNNPYGKNQKIDPVWHRLVPYRIELYRPETRVAI